jgi:methionine synthase II (cobalamin-independent)
MIDANISVEELVELYPETVAFLREKGIVCIICGEPVWGTLAELLESKGRMDELDILVSQLNELIA